MADYFVDSVNGDDANTGLSVAQAKRTLTQINALTGARGGDTVNLERSSTFRQTLALTDVNGTDIDTPFVINAYGDADSKPKILASVPASGFTKFSDKIYSKAFAAEQEAMVDNARIKKVTSLAAMYPGSAFYDSGVLYIYMPDGRNPDGAAEITSLDRAINITTTLGFVELRNMDARMSRVHGIRLAAEPLATPASCKIIQNHSQFHGIDSVVGGTASDCILFDGTSSAARGTGYEVAHNTGGDAFNNFIELSYMDGNHIHGNHGERMGGCMVELFRACSTNLIERNRAKDMTDEFNIAQFRESFVWIANTGGDVSTDNDVFYNIAINARVRGVNAEQGVTNVIGNVITGVENRAIDFNDNVVGNFAKGEIKNNIFGVKKDSVEWPTPKYINYETDLHTDMDIDGNTYWEQTDGPNIARWSTNAGAALPPVNTPVFADWIKATGAGGSGQDANSTHVTVAPLFTDFINDDVTLLPAANEVNAGVAPTAVVNLDFAGDPISASPDVGAYKNYFGRVQGGVSSLGN